jgi:cation:H+ antiporter
MLLLVDVAIYIAAFALIWSGTGLIVSSIDKMSRKLGVSSFGISFIVLGILTSTPEFAVGLTSIAEGKSEIFVGNLLGGIILIFLFIIPFLAVIGKGIKLDHGLDKFTILFCLLVILAPSLLILDNRVTAEEGILLISMYFMLIFFIMRREGLLLRQNAKLLEIKSYSLTDIFKILGGVTLVFIASNLIVTKTILFAEVLNVSPYLISLIALSLGTNLPELSLAIRSVVSRKKEVAFGDYLGSAATNTLLFGVFTLLNNGEILTSTNFVPTFIFTITGLGLFYIFTKSKNILSQYEGMILLSIYGLFLFWELYKYWTMQLN